MPATWRLRARLSLVDWATPQRYLGPIRSGGKLLPKENLRIAGGSCMFELDDKGTTRGPYTGAQIKELALKGKLFDDMRIRQLPDGNWKSVAMVKGVAIAERPLASPPRIPSATPSFGSPLFQVPATTPFPRPRPLPMSKPATLDNEVDVFPVVEMAEATEVEFEVKATQLVECPYCSEDIKPTAKKCKHCGEILDASLRSLQTAKPPATPYPPATTVVVQNTNVATSYAQPYRQHPRWDPTVAALLSFIFPGLGQIYKGQPVNGIVWMIAVFAGYFFFVLPGLVLHLLCIIGAASGDRYR